MPPKPVAKATAKSTAKKGGKDGEPEIEEEPAPTEMVKRCVTYWVRHEEVIIIFQP